MPGTQDPIGGVQGFVASIQALKTRITNLEVWQRTALLGTTGPAGPTGATGATGATGPPVNALLEPGGAGAPTRALGTVYQPSATRPTLVLIVLELTAAGASEAASARALLDSVNPPVAQIAQLNFNSGTGEPSETFLTPLTFLVPPGWFYELLDSSVGGASASVYSATEWTL